MKATTYLAYHEIVMGRPRYLYAVSTSQFAEHAAVIAQFSAVNDKGPPVPQFTFDDGHTSQFLHALPILEITGQKAIFFVTVGWTETRPGFMSWAHLQELIRRGHEVQSHGWSHAFLTQCSNRELLQELSHSKRILEDRLGTQVDALSAPGGRLNGQVARACAAVGYKRIFVSNPWIVNKDVFGMQFQGRWMITGQHDTQSLAKCLKGTAKELGMLRARYETKEIVKALLQDKIYQAVWRRVARKRESLESDYIGKHSINENTPTHQQWWPFRR